MADVRTSTKHHHLPFSPSFLPPTSTTSTLQPIPIANQTCTCNQPDILNHTACPVHESKAEEASAHLNTTEKQGETSLDQETVRPIRPQIRTQNQRSKQPRTIKTTPAKHQSTMAEDSTNNTQQPAVDETPISPSRGDRKNSLEAHLQHRPDRAELVESESRPSPNPSQFASFASRPHFPVFPFFELPSDPCNHSSLQTPPPVCPPHPPIPTTKPRASTRRRIMNITP